ncbi:MAG: hypothetical protein G8237_01205 [Magnetococcales bacterium]|nr:hypothetical protein [Magnetococcales bacterium]NGZ04954.1 hypothetical protein [Magnetococcales bacterium]
MRMTGEGSTRRQFLWHSVVWSAALWPAGCVLMPVRQGVQWIEGEAWLDGRILNAYDQILPGVTLSTGAHSRLVLVSGDDAFLLGAHTTLTFHSANLPESTPEPDHPASHAPPVEEPVVAAATGFTLQSGRVLSVFGSGARTLVIPTATIGVRGTGLFLQVAPEQDYLCLCYGTIEIRMQHALPGKGSDLHATHHASRYLTPNGVIHTAPMLNHTDEELFMLEALVNRRPPFEPVGRHY